MIGSIEIEKKNEQRFFFLDISITGRFAYGILCLKEAFNQRNEEFSSEAKAFNLLLNYLESVLEMEVVPNLERKFIELIPYTILENHVDNIFDNYEHYTVSELYELKKLYLILPDYIVELIDSIIEMMLCNLHRSTENCSPCSLKELDYIFKIFNTQSIDLPKIPNDIMNSKFSHKNGWGFPPGS